ncbi:MAG: beta-galactosidase [Bacteroidota bacterium]
MKINSVIISALVLSTIYFLGCSPSGETTKKMTLLSFEEGIAPTRVEAEDATFEIVENDNQNALKVSTGSALVKPGVVLKEPADKPWDLKGYYKVEADVTNIGDEKIQVEMYVGDDPDGLTKWYCSDYIDLEPNESGTITVPLAWTKWVHEPQLDIAGMRGIPGKIKTDIDAIVEVSFYSRYATQENQFLVHQVRAVEEMEVRDTAGFFPFIDEFGQFKHRDWKNKIHSEKDLKQMAKIEKEINEKNIAPDRNKYGGWATGPQLEATGWFRTEKVNDKWWMVDPEGKLFWTTGLNCMASTSGISGVQGREHYFEGLPSEDSPLAQFYDEGRWASHGFYKDKLPFKAYQFNQSNLYRKYGENWLQQYRENIHTRMKSWGFNTIGFVSDNGATQMRKTPYVGTVWITGTPKIEGSAGFWGKFHDVFDTQFRLAVRSSMERQKEGAGDPWCLGYFVDNELSWGKTGSLAEGALRSPATQPAKIEFVNDLKKKYQKIAQLNAAWKTNHASWDALLNHNKVPTSAEAQVDLTNFYKKIALTYFRTIKEELNRIAPNQMYIGCRFAWNNNDPTLKAAAKYCDVVSFNKYEYSVENVSMPKGIDKPIMIGEFHFGALDRGSLHVGVKSAKSQEHRGDLYKAYIQGALRNPQIVGAHWFQYMDEATSGREDGENYNVGFIDICDTPYEDMLVKVRETTYPMYEYRYNPSQKSNSKMIGKK